MLAPLEGVADTVFRQIIAACTKPDDFVTEFTSAEGFCSPGRDIVSQNLKYSEGETPIIAQLWGKNPDSMYKAVTDVSAMGFSGIDINMGCPDRSVMAHGSGGALISSPDTAAAVIQAAKRGIKDSGKPLSMSVKTRIGRKQIITEEWATFLLEQGIDALTIHGRTVADLSKVPAHCDEIGKVVALRDRMKVETVIIGNGDVTDVSDGLEKAKVYGVDGIMIGRGVFANLWAFDRTAHPHRATPRELIGVMERHVRLFEETWGDRKNFAILKKFFKIYVNGFRGSTEWRVRCMAANSTAEILGILNELNVSSDIDAVSI